MAKLQYLIPIMFSKMRQKISLIRQKSLFTRHMGQTGLLKITQTRHCAGEDRRQSKEKPMLSSTGWNTPEKRGSYRMRNTLFRIFRGGGQTTSERREDVPCGNGRRSSELREESSSRKPEIALPRQGSSGALCKAEAGRPNKITDEAAAIPPLSASAPAIRVSVPA